jgi:hypothetical protein
LALSASAAASSFSSWTSFRNDSERSSLAIWGYRTSFLEVFFRAIRDFETARYCATLNYWKASDVSLFLSRQQVLLPLQGFPFRTGTCYRDNRKCWGGVANFLFRHSGLKIAPQTQIRLPPSAPSLRCSFRPPLLLSLPAKSEAHPASSETCLERTSAPQSTVDRHITYRQPST